MKKGEPSKSGQQTTLHITRKYSSTYPRQVRITTALVSFVVGDLLPLSVVESEGLRTFVHSLDPRYQVPSRKHFSSVILQNHFEIIQNNVQTVLNEVTYVSVTMDLWTNRQMRSFRGLCAPFIRKWKMESVVLGCCRFKGRHVAEKIYQQYEDILSHFGIARKVRHVVTDSVSNMVKAFQLPGFMGLEQ